MEIKNIRQFRTFFKEKVKKSIEFRNEHFVGVHRILDNDEDEFGFFELYHGQKEGVNQEEGIRGFLEGFLEMAKDGQAVYEFLQNAVDAQSEHFAMFWDTDSETGEDYLLVVNNGKVFDYNSISSILNVGVSTKTTKDHSIGKFGIGFKLAHRLVGKTNGLDELIKKNYGPILFSWKNNKIQELINLGKNQTIPKNQKAIVLTENQKRIYKFEGEEPWLFKILITNFPCAPENKEEEEKIDTINTNNVTNAFSLKELELLSRWTKDKFQKLPIENFKEGSLFLIRLGEGKSNHLEEENLEEGIKFSKVILNQVTKRGHKKLQHITLQGKQIDEIDLKFIKFTISKENDLTEFRYIKHGKEIGLTEEEKNSEKDDEDVEILFGYTNYNNAFEIFKNAPNFYLYFPLSEEKHRLKFILHSNAFYKSSSRTFLQKGTNGKGINERILTKFIELLEIKLKDFLETNKKTSKNEFIDIYASLLLSEDSSHNTEREWINKPLYEPIEELIKKYIPVKINIHKNKFELENKISAVKIKKTDLNFNPEDFGLSFKWFFWSWKENQGLANRAQRKLNIEQLGITEILLAYNVHEKINLWLENNKTEINILLKELNGNIPNFDKNSIPKLSNEQETTYKNNLYNLKLFFINNETLSLKELNADDVWVDNLILFPRNTNYKHYLLKAGFNLTNIDFSDYPELFKYIHTARFIKYFNDFDELFNIFNTKFKKINFSSDEKKDLFILITKSLQSSFRSADERISRMRTLELFQNYNTTILPCAKILTKTVTEKKWLSNYKINKNDYFEKLDEYLLNDDTHIYKQIIFPFWTKIIQNNFVKDNPSKFYKDVKEYFSKTPNEITLNSYPYILSKTGEFEYSKDVFYLSNFEKYANGDYEVISSFFNELCDLKMPKYEILKFLSDVPFEKAESKFDFSIKNQDYIATKNEINIFLEFCKTEYQSFFNDYYIEEVETGYKILPQDNETKFEYVNIKSETSIFNYIEKYYHGKYKILPENINSYNGIEITSESELLNFLLDDCSLDIENNKEQIVNFTKILLSNPSYIPNFINRNPELNLQLGNISEYEISIIQLLERLNDNNYGQDWFNTNVQIYFNDAWRNRNELAFASSDIVQFGERNQYEIAISKILIDDVQQQTKLAQDLINEIKIKYNKFSEESLKKIFNLSENLNKDEIFEKLNENIESQTLLSGEQVAFIILYNNYKKEINLSNYEVNTVSGTINLKNILILNESNFSYYNDNYRLTESYNSLATLLHLGEKDKYFKSGNSEITIIINPFISGNQLHLKPLRNDISEQEQFEIFKYLYSLWKIDKKEKIELIIDISIKDLLGFEPEQKIYSKFAFETTDADKYHNEILPAEIVNWIDNDDVKKDFLKAIGINTDDSNIVKIRQWLIGNSVTDKPKTDNISNELLKNSLLFFQNRNEINPIIFKEDDEIFKVLENIIADLPVDEVKLYPLPYSVDKDKYIFDFCSKSDYYIKETGVSILEINNIEISKIIKQLDNKLFLTDLRSINGIEDIAQQIEISEPKIDTDSLNEKLTEWDRPFYHKWRKDNEDSFEIRLFDGNVPYNIFVKNEDEIIMTFSIHKVEKGMINNIFYFYENVRDEAIIQEIKKTEDINSLVLLFEAYNKERNYLIGEIEKNPDIKEDFKKIKQKQEQIEKRTNLIKNLQEEKKYSYNWFKCYLEYIQTYAEVEHRNPKTIRFQKIKRYKLKEQESEKFLLLCGANSLIPVSIDDFVDFEISLTFKNKKKEKIDIENVSKRGQDLLVYSSSVVSENILSKLKNLVSIKISFTPVINLLEKLNIAFFNQDIVKPWGNIKIALPPVHYIYGPPGTGKTTLMSKIIASGEIQKGFEDTKISDTSKCLILTPTNKAADVLAKKIITKYHLKNVIRIGKPTDPELEELDEEIYKSSLTCADITYSNIIISTIHRLPYFQVVEFEENEPKHLYSLDWDYVFFDEASMLNLPYIVFALMIIKTTNPNVKFIIAGDPKQIPPVIDITDKELENMNIDDENIYKMMELNSFDPDAQNIRDIDKIENLTTQYRSIPAIGKLFSKFAYDNLLNHDRKKSTQKKLPAEIQNLINKDVTFINMPLDSDNSVYEKKTLFKSSYHIYSAIFVSEFIKYFDKNLDEGSEWTIGLIAPYKSQAVLMNKLITSYVISDKIKIYCDTVHGFQGDECDMVFFIVNPNNYRYTGHSMALLSKEYIYNVAISRARDYLIVIHPFESIKDNSHVNKIAESYSQNYEVISSHDIERSILSDDKFIENNSYVTGHDSINIFGQIEMKYYIKASENAIDIQLRKV